MQLFSKDSILIKHKHWLVPLIVFVLALSIRLVYLGQLEKMPTFNNPIMDEKYHVELANQINSEEGMDPEPFYRAPLYPFWFAFWYDYFDGSLYGPRVIQIVLGSFLPLLILLLGIRLFSFRTGAIAAFMAAIYPLFIYYDSSLLITSIMTILTTLLVWQLYRTESRPSYINFIITGCLLGLAGLARPNILLLGPFLALWIWMIFKSRFTIKEIVLRYVLIGLTSLVVIAPVTIRNYTASGDLVFIAWQGGFNFYLGNNPNASGWSATVPGIDFSWEGGYKEAIAIAEQTEGRELKRSEVSEFWYDRAWSEIGNNPQNFVRLTFKKMLLFINGYEIPNNQDIYFTRDYTPVLKPLLFEGLIYFPFGIISALAIIGLLFSFREWRKYLIVYLLIVSYVTSLLLFFVCARFRMPLMPLILLLSVFGAGQLLLAIRSGDIKRWLLPVFVFLLFFITVNNNIVNLNPDRVKAESHMNMGLAYLEKNIMSQASREFRWSVKFDSTFAPGYSNLGVTFTRMGKLTEATDNFKRALQLEPRNPNRYLNLATNFTDRGDRQSTIKLMEKANEMIPNHPTILARLGHAYYDVDRLVEAREMVIFALKIDPKNPMARQVAGLIQQKEALNSTP